ncbi:MAG TPA: M48 family metallopeptidase, partial [Verrucomicrobiae bacterium]|nr:M48 family metallopeptidase [Verrucomicrobiae bacterium]
MEGATAQEIETGGSKSFADTQSVSPLDSFTGIITPQPVSPLYKIGLAVVAFAMVLLPAVYGFFILLAGWTVVLLVKNDFSDGGTGKLTFYLGPACGILIFFMLKPLFAKRPVRVQAPTLDPAKEPLLFAFVQRICEQVRAPMPSRIDVDCQINASASLRRGFWSRDLVLTIGLPLAAGLDMREFAGVLAHEFGHFAQGAGMRLTYIIRNINFWFARVVFERDQWDQHLERWSKRLDIRLAIVLHAARLCVWLTRRILWLLMHAGHGISCFMLRQMEYDADSYETKLAGSDAFESTATRLRELNAAMQLAVEEVRQDWASRRLPENLPLLVQHKAASLPAELQQKYVGAADSKKTGWFDTHPCDSDRVKAARALAQPGVFRIERPATELFADFNETGKAVTRFQYEKHWKLEFSAQNLVASEEMLRESAVNAEADAAIRKFYGEVNITLAPLLNDAQLPPLTDRDTAMTQWREAREESLRLRPQAEKASGECLVQQARLVQMMGAWSLSRAGFKLEAKAFGFPASATSVADQEIAGKFAVEEASGTIRQQIQMLNPFVAALRTRITLALQLTRPAATNGEPASELDKLIKALAATGKTLPTLHEIGIRLRPFTVLAQNRGNHRNPMEVSSHMNRIADELQKLAAEAQLPLGGLAYPFPHPRGQLSVIEYARYEKPTQNRWEEAY